MSRLLIKNADFIGNAVYRGRLYRIDSYPGAVPSTDPKHSVRGELYRLRNANRLLPRLDRYEGIGPEFRMPHEYQRQQQPVRLDNGRSVMAWLYLYNRPTAGLEIIEAGDSDETDSDK